MIIIDNNPEQAELKWVLTARLQGATSKYACLNVDQGLAICSDGHKTRICETCLPDGVYTVEQEPDRLVLELEPIYSLFREEELMNTDCTVC